ncbi:MAG TPA: histidine phosphatase family protein [Acidimicrobiales bacterium]|nr:histidine phosphatase family protein [Acidimicrobiales bacterium]
MDGTRVVLVRHGHSVAQEEGFLSGHDTCKGLSDLGRKQVEALRDRLGRTGELAGAAALYASILPRAIETAELLAPVVGGHAVRTDCGFCEAHVGEAEGKPYAELLEGLPEEWDEERRPFEGWETWREMGERVARSLDATIEQHLGQTIVIACHGGVIVHAMQRWLALEAPNRAGAAWFAPANSSLTEFRGAPNPYRSGTLAVELVRYNDHAHLAGRDL